MSSNITDFNPNDSLLLLGIQDPVKGKEITLTWRGSGRVKLKGRQSLQCLGHLGGRQGVTEHTLARLTAACPLETYLPAVYGTLWNRNFREGVSSCEYACRNALALHAQKKNTNPGRMGETLLCQLSAYAKTELGSQTPESS